MNEFMNTSETLHNILDAFKKEQLPTITDAAEAGDAEAQLQLGVLYANGRGVKSDPEQAKAWLEKAASQGRIEALTLLGWLHARGEAKETNPMQAAVLFQKAAEAGDSDAQCSFADLIHEHGVKEQAAMMLHWYQQAAQQNHPKAQYMLGKLLADGDWVEGDEEMAFEWLTHAIINGSEPAQKELQMLSARLGSMRVEAIKQNLMKRAPQTH